MNRVLAAKASVCVAVLAFVFFSASPAAAEEVKIDAAKVAQLRRLEPLSADKIDVFVLSGQLTQQQADLVKKHLDPNGSLALPASVIGVEPPRVIALPEPAAPATPVAPPATAEVPAAPASTFSTADRTRLQQLIEDFRNGGRSQIGQELRRNRPAVNALIEASYPDPIDLPIKAELWSEVAGPANPGAAHGVILIHRAAMELAKPILVPYAKDVGGVLVRRKQGTGNPQRYFTSRELRDLIVDIERRLAVVGGPEAAMYLMEVYAQRYGGGEAPMRDKGRDRKRMVEACGGDYRKFDQDEPGTWKCRLAGQERAGIADMLIPHLHRGDEDKRDIARNGLQIVLPRGHPSWDDGATAWERWWEQNRTRVYEGR